jgi:RES domain-containing protein
MLDAHAFVAFPSVVSKSGWNVVFRPDRANGKYIQQAQDRLVLDTRFNPPGPRASRVWAKRV